LEETLTEELLEKLRGLAQSADLDLLGLELTLEQALSLPERQDWSIPMGFMIKGGSKPLTSQEEAQALERILSYDPSLVLGGPGMTGKAWGEIAQALQSLHAT